MGGRGQLPLIDHEIQPTAKFKPDFTQLATAGESQPLMQLHTGFIGGIDHTDQHMVTLILSDL